MCSSDLTLQPAPGLIPYSINHPFWSDHALKRRWVSIPDPTETFGFSENGPWRLPSRVVWVKHFDMEVGGGVLRRIETRILVKSGDGFYGASYRWAPDQKDASLVPPEGADDIVLVPEENAIRLQRWRSAIRGAPFGTDPGRGVRWENHAQGCEISLWTTPKRQ